MRKHFRSLIAMALFLTLLVGLMPVSVSAAEDAASESRHLTGINPLYADVIDESDLIQPRLSADSADDVTYYSDTEGAGAAVRAEMREWENTIIFGYHGSTIDREFMNELLSVAFTHTGNPKEGDYLRWHYTGWDVLWSEPDSYGRIIITLTMTYYTTKAQENAVDAAVEELRAELIEDDFTDYEKVKSFYDWICASITYDYDGLENEDYTGDYLHYTAYGGIIERTCVCQGYASLFYRLALEEGIDTRLIAGYAGEAHGWNIVQLDGLYYNLDTTWDAELCQNGIEYQYFLKSPGSFPNHTPYADYDSAAFHAEYPMASSDYNPYPCSDGHTSVSVEPIAATCTTEGRTAGTRCYICGEILSGCEVTPLADHTEVTVAAVESTCTSDGTAAGVYCEVCRKVLSGFDIIPAAGHSWGDWVVISEPTETTDGQQYRFCPSCEKTEFQDIPAYGLDNPFVDVSSDAYYYDPVLWAVDMGITEGKDSTHFAPGEPCTRAQVVTFLWRANGCPEPVNYHNPFVDVPTNAYYYKAVLWAVQNGITEGRTANSFAPSEACTRAQVVTFLWRLGGREEMLGSSPFIDVGYGKYYYEPVLWAVENGITQGKTAYTFEPNEICIRAQIVTFLYRAMA